MEKKIDDISTKEETSRISQTRYDYFTICHSFVSQMKKFNELRNLKKIRSIKL